MDWFGALTDLWIYLGIILVVILFFLLSELFEPKKISKLFEKISQAILEFFT